MLFGVMDGSGNINTVRIINTTGDITQADDFTPQLLQKASSNTTHVAKALYHHSTAFRLQTHILPSCTSHDLYPTSSGLKATLTPSNRERLPGHGCRNRVTFLR